jgi:ABC-type phosphate transport system substrate-binding protein
MKLAKYLSMVVLLLAPFTAQLHAQALAGAVAGSSALWVAAGQGAANNGGAAQVNCSWTSTASGVTFTLDSRVAAPFNQENGNLWVVWTPAGGSCAAPGAGSQVYAYINLDSTIGNRCLFAQPSCTLNTTAAALTAGANKLPGDVDTALPASILAVFNGASINIAATDIMPADAKFVTYRALALCGPLSPGTQFQGLGYGPGPVGQNIASSYSSKVFHVIDFNVFGNDPITGTAIPAYTIYPVGADPELVIVNNTNASGFGSASVKDVSRATLALLFSGILVRTADVITQPFAGLGAAYAPVTAHSREFLSGTYNVFEHNIPNNKEMYRSQETGNCTNGTNTVTTNPMNLTRTISQGGTVTTGNHKRVIGTGEAVQFTATTADSIGYAFWSSGNFATSTAYNVGNLKYLTVDGIDPIFNSYSNGTIPNSGNGLLPNVTLTHVVDGSYPIWSEIRFVAFAAGGAAATQLQSWAQTQVSFGAGATQPDFIIAPNLNTFRAHFARPFINFNAGNVASDGPRVCGAGSNNEDGGDVGGIVMSLQAGADYCVLKNNYGAAGGVGPTNTASFGVTQ